MKRIDQLLAIINQLLLMIAQLLRHGRNTPDYRARFCQKSRSNHRAAFLLFKLFQVLFFIDFGFQSGG